ncbi:MAG: GHKL domain-containing protein [Firmicutes bacterium]|nr:GHKL domain-containing protein [Bacillota bacterium]
MSKNYYLSAIIMFAVQLILLAMLINNMLMGRFDFFQPFKGEMIELFVGIAVFGLNIGAIFIIRNLYTSSIRSQRFKIDMLKFKHIEEQNRIYRQHRHDLNNHLSIISGLAELGELERLRNYLSSYVAAFNRSIVTVDTGLQELDVLIYTKISEATTKGVDVSFSCHSTVTCCQKYIISLITILSNALDNAIEACEKTSEKELDIKIKVDPVDYTFIISNTYDRSIDLEKKLAIEGYSSKGNRRGEGLSIIKKTVNYFEGEYQIKTDNGWFFLVIELPKHRLEECI